MKFKFLLPISALLLGLVACNDPVEQLSVPSEPTDFSLVKLVGLHQNGDEPLSSGMFAALNIAEAQDDSSYIYYGAAAGFAIDSLFLIIDSSRVTEADTSYTLIDTTIGAAYLDVGEIKVNDVALDKNNQHHYSYSPNSEDPNGIPYNFSATWELGSVSDSGFAVMELPVIPHYPSATWENNVSITEDFVLTLTEPVFNATRVALLVEGTNGLRYYEEDDNHSAGSRVFEVSQEDLLTMGRGEFTFYVMAWGNAQSRTLTRSSRIFEVFFRNQSVLKGKFVFN